MTTAMTIRPARASDADAIRTLVAVMGSHEEAAADPGSMTALRVTLEDPGARCLVATAGADGVVGYVEVQARASVLHACQEACLTVLAVAEVHRGSGVGSALLAEAERQVALLGCTQMCLESSLWRSGAHGFYLAAGCEDTGSARRFRKHLQPSACDDLALRFLAAAAAAATQVAGALCGLREAAPVGTGADGAPTEAADAAAEVAAWSRLAGLGLPVLSEESGALGGRQIDGAGPWIALDPLDGSRNYRHGMPPWATSMGLVVDGRPVAGLVCDLTSGRRWWAAKGRGSWVDGRPSCPRAGELIAMAAPGSGVELPQIPDGYQRVRVSGSTTVDLCRVADGSVGTFDAMHREVVHVHDLAGPMAVLLEAGATVLDSTGHRPYLLPDPLASWLIVASATRSEAERILALRLGASQAI